MVTIPIDAWLAGAEAQRRQTGRPLVTLSWAQSIDGSLTTRRGETLSLSGPASIRLTHQLRAAHEAIVVGIGTVLADNPQLTVRLVQGQNPQPVVLDSHLVFPQGARLLQAAKLPWLATIAPANPDRIASFEAQGVRILQLPADSHQRVDLPAFLEALASQGISSIMVEGGARLLTSFLQDGLADRVVITIAPVLVGGLAVVSERLSPIPKLLELGYQQLEQDLIVWGVPKW